MPLLIVGHETIAVSTTAVGLTVPAALVTHAIIRVNDNNVRWRADGTDPTSADGKTQLAGDEFELTGENEITRFKAIRETSDAEIDVIYLTSRP